MALAKALILGTLLGGLVMFAWGAVSHVLIPYGTLVFLRFSDENTVARAIVANAPRSGIYFLPYMPEGDPAGMQAAQEKLARGPFLFAAVRVEAVGETNSNFGFTFPWWDWLCGTYRAQPAAGHDAMTIGLEAFRDPRYLRLDQLLIQPLLEPAGPYAITGRRMGP